MPRPPFVPAFDNVYSIELSDLQALVDSGVSEDVVLEFKAYPTDGQLETRKFQKTMAAFANTSGGCICYGIDAPTGRAENLSGIPLADIDRVGRTLEQSANAGIRERLDIRQHHVVLGDDRAVLLLATPPSRNRPHVVVEGMKFYRRASKNNEEMDLTEIRRQMTSGSDAESEAIAAHKAAVSTRSNTAPNIHLTITPTPARKNRLDTADAAQYSAVVGRLTAARVLSGALGISHRRVFNGMRWWVALRGEASPLEWRVTSTGEISGVYRSFIRNNDGRLSLPIDWFAGRVHEMLRAALGVLRLLDANAACHACFTLTSVHGMEPLSEHRESGPLAELFRVEEMSLDCQAIYLDSQALAANDLRAHLRPWLDQICQAMGLERCIKYMPDGTPIAHGWQ